MKGYIIEVGGMSGLYFLSHGENLSFSVTPYSTRAARYATEADTVYAVRILRRAYPGMEFAVLNMDMVEK